MHSILFQLGSLPPIRTYGVCMALGFLGGWLAAHRLSRKTGQNAEYLSSLVTWLMLAAIVGARLAYVIEHWRSEFADHLAAIARVDQGGLMFYGGLIGAALLMVSYARVYRRQFLALTDLIVTVLPLGHMFGRLGCFFHGCCYGKITDSFLGVCFPRESPAWYEQVAAVPPLLAPTAPQSLPVIPTQLIEAAANALLFVVLYRLYPRSYKTPGLLSGIYLLSYAVLRFAVEYLRGDPRVAFGPFSVGQVISLGIFMCGLGCLWRARGQGGRTPEGVAEA